jgi:hypothetical protein
MASQNILLLVEFHDQSMFVVRAFVRSGDAVRGKHWAEARGWRVPYCIIALAVTACGRRQGGVGGFAAGGILLAACRCFYRLTPAPSPCPSASGILKAMEKGNLIGFAFGVQKLKHLAISFADLKIHLVVVL